MPAGQQTWENQGYGTNDYVVSFETQKNLAYEYRQRSVIGKLSKPVSTKTVGSGPAAREMDIAQSAATWSKEISKGDECRFTLEQMLTGDPTYGDAAVRDGDYLAYLHATVFLNQLDTPAFPLAGDMSAQRVADVLSDPQGQMRNAITMYLSEQYVIDYYEGFLRGASRNLLAARADGGRALNLGISAGTQVSPENFLVAGSGFVSGTSGTSGYETQLGTDLAGLTDTAGDYISRDFIHSLRYAITDRKIKPVMMDGAEKWFAPCDPYLMARLTKPGGGLDEAWKTARERSKENPAFGHGTIELNDIVFFPDYWLGKFAPDITSGVIYGQSGIDRREFTPTSTIRLMLILGDGSMLDAHNGEVNITVENGRHGKGKTLSGHIKQSFMRTRYIPKDGRSSLVVNQSGMCCAFYEPGLSF